MVARSGARLCEEQREERNTNREGVASGSATKKYIGYFSFMKPSAIWEIFCLNNLKFLSPLKENDCDKPTFL
jgi:hypothetical protein